MDVRRGVMVLFWWFMVVSQYPGGTLSAATQGPFGTQAQCEWGRQQVGATTGLRGGQGVGWGLTPCWSDGRWTEEESTMKALAVLLLAVVLVVFPFAGIAAEKKITDVKELAGSYQGWVTTEMGQERATMIVQPNGNYKASTVRGSAAEGQFYLQDGKLLYRSSRTTGKAQLTEDKGKTTLSVIPDDTTYGRGDYARNK